jgi:chromosome partitioning protein
MILTVGNTKGGVGKTTLAINLAITRANDGRSMLLVDGDEQRSAAAFTELRNEALGTPGYTAVALDGSAIRTQVQQLAPKFDDVVIDVGGRNTASLRAALTVSDTLLVPAMPSTFDVWAIEDLAAVLDDARSINPEIKTYLVINAADPQGRDNQDAAEALAEIPGVEVLPITIGRRKAFRNAAAAGQSVIEQGRDAKATAEMRVLADTLYGHEMAEV